MAITKYDQFDFLIDIVPRDELKPTKSRDDANRAGVPADQVGSQALQVTFSVVTERCLGWNDMWLEKGNSGVK